MLLQTKVLFNGKILNGFIDSENLKDSNREYFYFYDTNGNLKHPNLIKREAIL